MPSSTPRWIFITIRFLGVFSGVLCICFLLSFISLAIAITFQKHEGNINPWILSGGLIALVALLFAVVFTAKKLFFSTIPDLVKQLPSCMGFSFFVIANIFLYAFTSHEPPKGHSLVDLSRLASPWVFAWIGYRLTKTFIERYYLSITAGDARPIPHDCPKCGFFVLDSTAACPNCHAPAYSAANKNS